MKVFNLFPIFSCGLNKAWPLGKPVLEIESMIASVLIELKSILVDRMG